MVTNKETGMASIASLQRLFSDRGMKLGPNMVLQIDIYQDKNGDSLTQKELENILSKEVKVYKSQPKKSKDISDNISRFMGQLRQEANQKLFEPKRNATRAKSTPRSIKKEHMQKKDSVLNQFNAEESQPFTNKNSTLNELFNKIQIPKSVELQSKELQKALNEIKSLKEQITNLKVTTNTSQAQLKRLETDTKIAKEEAAYAKFSLKGLTRENDSQKAAIDQLKVENRELKSASSSDSKKRAEELNLMREEIKAIKEKIVGLKESLRKGKAQTDHKEELANMKTELELLKYSLDQLKEVSVKKSEGRDGSKHGVNHSDNEGEYDYYGQGSRDDQYFRQPRSAYHSEYKPNRRWHRGYNSGRGHYNIHHGRGYRYRYTDEWRGKHRGGRYRHDYSNKGYQHQQDSYRRYDRSYDRNDKRSRDGFEYVPKENHQQPRERQHSATPETEQLGVKRHSSQP